MLNDEYGIFIKNKTVVNLIDTIKALQQENEQYNQDRINAQGLWAEACEDVIKLQQENEQLRAQVARMRDVLDELTSELDYAHLLENGIEWDKHKSKIFDGALELLKNIPADYHNPADVEALRKAREALTIVSDYYSNVLNMAAWKTVKEALAAIDKVIGGKEDAGNID
jgi:predicted nuclease with TOPRIM domain